MPKPLACKLTLQRGLLVPANLRYTLVAGLLAHCHCAESGFTCSEIIKRATLLTQTCL